MKFGAADTAVVGSWGATTVAWFADINEILQFIALVAAIVSAFYAIRVHRKELKRRK